MTRGLRVQIRMTFNGKQNDTQTLESHLAECQSCPSPMKTSKLSCNFLTCFSNVRRSQYEQFDPVDVVAAAAVTVAVVAASESDNSRVIQSTDSLRCHIVVLTRRLPVAD